MENLKGITKTVKEIAKLGKNSYKNARSKHKPIILDLSNKENFAKALDDLNVRYYAKLDKLMSQIDLLNEQHSKDLDKLNEKQLNDSKDNGILPRKEFQKF